MTIWMTTDTHIGHENIKKFCNRPDDCDQKIFRALGALRFGDILIHLGDVSMNTEGERQYLGNIPAGVHKWLVLGNHDRSMVSHLKMGWDWVGDAMTMKRWGELIKFSHKPVPIGEETIQFHGHFHNNSPEYWEEHLKSIMTPQHHLIVIEDMNYCPATLESLVNEAQKKRPL